ncbi:MAG: hypothetical protein ACLR3S_06150 [Clostridium fessum]
MGLFQTKQADETCLDDPDGVPEIAAPLDFYLPLSVGWSEYRETSVCEKGIQNQSLRRCQRHFKGDGRKIVRKRCTYYGK